MNPVLLAALINNIAIPELTAWLKSRHDKGELVTDSDVLNKIVSDTNLGISLGSQWLAQHPAP